MQSLRKYAANNIEKNASYNFRERRIKIFSELLRNFKSSCICVLDIGGESNFWNYWKQHLSKKIDVTLINISHDAINGNKGIVGDATNLDFIKDNQFDLVFSNSLMEHLNTFENQKVFAREIRRIASFYFVQTPAFLFPLETHFLFPFFHWLPKRIRIILHQKFNLGWYNAEADYLKAKKHVDEIRIMKKGELQTIYPEGRIIVEKYFLFPKSYVITNLEYKVESQ